MKDTYCVIMAGGIGSRFWPMSRTSKPKQFLDILGTGKTLIRQTFERFGKICPEENVLVVTSDIYKEQVHEQIPELTEDQILCEPKRRNTAPCIAYAAYKIAEVNPNANMVVAPSDHLITKQETFEKVVDSAIEQTCNGEYLVTLGIKPSRPDTGYGYIQFDYEISGVNDTIKKVITFTEKPSHDLAINFLESGDFYWNSGIFIWSVSNILHALEQYLPEVNDLFKAGKGKYNTTEEETFINETYETCENISIDYGIMEKSEDVYVVLSDIGWSDLGTWGSLQTHMEMDENKNATTDSKVKFYDSSDCIVNMKEGKLAVIQGLDGYIVVDTDDVLMVCRKEDEQKIRDIVNDVSTERGSNIHRRGH